MKTKSEIESDNAWSWREEMAHERLMKNKHKYKKTQINRTAVRSAVDRFLKSGGKIKHQEMKIEHIVNEVNFD